MARHWIVDREDPRAVMLVSVLVLLVGGCAAVPMVRQGGGTAVYAGVWVLVVIGQLIWAAAHLRRWRRDRASRVD